MDRVYAPWRSKYVSQETNKKDICVFCDIAQNKQNDKQYKVIYRCKECFVVMNKYPYSPAHFMIIPNYHTANLEDLDITVWLKITTLAQQGVKLLKDTMKAQGVNIGMNLGKAGGAGIAPHIHLHLVPRWEGDTNFITTVANTRVFSTDFEKLYQKLKLNAPKYFKCK